MGAGIDWRHFAVEREPQLHRLRLRGRRTWDYLAAGLGSRSEHAVAPRGFEADHHLTRLGDGQAF